MPNNKLFKIGDSFLVDPDTGEAVPIEGGGFRMLPGRKGTCSMCHVKHAPDQPHNQQSLAYKMKFHAINGRYPTWSDAMAHCALEVRQTWKNGMIALMEEKGIEVPDDLRHPEI